MTTPNKSGLGWKTRAVLALGIGALVTWFGLSGVVYRLNDTLGTFVLMVVCVMPLDLLERLTGRAWRQPWVMVGFVALFWSVLAYIPVTIACAVFKKLAPPRQEPKAPLRPRPSPEPRPVPPSDGMPDLRPRPSPEPRPVSLRGATSDQSAPLPQRKRLLIAFWTGLILGMTGAIWAEGTLFSVCVQPAYLIGILCLPLGVVVPQNPFMLGLLAGLFWFVVTYLVVTVWAQRQQRRRQRLSAPVPALSAPAMPRTQRLLIASCITFPLAVIGAIWGGETAGIGPMASIGTVIVMPGFLFFFFLLLLLGGGAVSAGPTAIIWLAAAVFWFGLIYLLVTAWDQGRRQLKR